MLLDCPQPGGFRAFGFSIYGLGFRVVAGDVTLEDVEVTVVPRFQGRCGCRPLGLNMPRPGLAMKVLRVYCRFPASSPKP